MKFLLYISIALFTQQLASQNRLVKKVDYRAQKLIIELAEIDNLVLIHNKENKVEVIMEDYLENQTTLSLEATDNLISINSAVVGSKVKSLDKFCTVQPLFPSYKVSVPRGIEIVINYNSGNFESENFEGDLRIQLEKGNLELKKFKGNFDLQLYSGNIRASLLPTFVDIVSNKGRIVSELNLKEAQRTASGLKGEFMNSGNTFKVRTIKANIDLYEVISQ